MLRLGSGHECSTESMETRREFVSWMSARGEQWSPEAFHTDLAWGDCSEVGSTKHTQRPGQVLKHLGGYERLRQLSEVQFEDPGDHIYLSGPQPGHCFTQI